MAYLALARKWRPRTFAEVVGQSHVVKALTNALDSGRVHHAFLFTGTRGVGKTTLARIFAKSLNCEQGVSAEPCQQCNTCLSIDDGRFVDLIEVDAASRTKVDDTRELLENVQYAPSVGKYKVYLIDEVHMLSGHSFNALLKTLEEPPEHVKFLFATTDPQKLPITVISRCLQFNLRALRPDQIENQLNKIVESESIEYDGSALQAISNAADGSMRDGLSLLDQAIAQGANTVKAHEVQNMLGTIKSEHSEALIVALAQKDAPKLMQLVADMADEAVDFTMAIDDVLMKLYYLSVAQVSAQSLPSTLKSSGINESFVTNISSQLDPEEVQLFYQIALLGKRDISLAPSLRVGFEMALLRMLAFEPDSSGGGQVNPPSSTNNEASPVDPVSQLRATLNNQKSQHAQDNLNNGTKTAQSIAHVESPRHAIEKSQDKETDNVSKIQHDAGAQDNHLENNASNELPSSANPNANLNANANTSLAGRSNVESPVSSDTLAKAKVEVKAKAKVEVKAEENASSATNLLVGENEWGALIEQTPLIGMVKELAMNSACERLMDEKVELSLSPKYKHLHNEGRANEIKEAIQVFMPKLVDVSYEFEVSDKETPAECLQRLGYERLDQTKQAIEGEPGIKALVNEFNVRIVEDSIKPI